MAAPEGEMRNYNKSLIQYAKGLRKNATPWERKLWYLFLSRYPQRFQRQKTIDNYIVDFYCAKVKLAIELDGSGHYTEEQIKYDSKRTNVLKSYGIKILRFCNNDIDTKFESVCATIDMVVNKSLLPTASPSAPSTEGEEE